MQHHINWTDDQWSVFKALPHDQVLHMLNLVRLREKADYPEDHPKYAAGLSGWEAYRDYGRESAPIFARVGGRQLWVGRPEALLIGPGDERWDVAFIAEYPDFDAFLALMRDDDYREAVQNRTAAALDSRLIRCKPAMPGSGFGTTAV